MIKLQREAKCACAIGVSSFLAYTGCYVGKNILSAMLPQMISGNVYGMGSLSAMGSAFLVTYGVGQLVNGLVGNRIGAKYMVSAGLFLSGMSCWLFPTFSSAAQGVFLWGACGFLCSMLWGPISRLIGENTSKKIGTVLLTLMTVASIAGTAVAYLFAGVSALRRDWKFGFSLTGAVLMALAVFWFFAVGGMVRKGFVGAPHADGKAAGMGPVAATLLKNGFVAMALAAMLNGIIRNAVAFWIPTYICQRFSISAADSAGISSILPFTNLVGTLLSVYFAKRMANDEKKALAVFFAFTTLMFGLMWLLRGRGTILNIAALFCASAAMTGGCNLIFTYYVLRFSSTGKISGITGFLDFVSYVSASAANALFSLLVPVHGWDFVVGTWAAVALSGTVVSWYAMRSARSAGAAR